MRYAFPILVISILLAGASPLCAMSAGGGMGGGGGGGYGGGGGGGGFSGGSGGNGMIYEPAWVTMAAALDAKGGTPAGIVLVFAKNPDTSALWTDKLLADATFKRLRHVRVDVKKGEDHVSKYDIASFPSLVFCDGHGNPVQVLERPGRAGIKAAYAGLAERIETQHAELRKQLAAIDGLQSTTADATLQRIAALAGPIADEARRMLAKRQPGGMLPTP